jgi:diguanylate cyclase (GGDEF)-like protein/PAS domain S-box-containing protein
MYPPSDDHAEHEALLQFLYLCPVGIIKFQASGQVELLNPKAAELLLPLTEIASLDNLFTVLDRWAPELRQLVIEFAHPQGLVVENRQTEFITADERRASVFLSVTIIKIDREWFMAVLSDITRVVEQQRMLRVREERLQAIFNGVRDYAIYTLDKAGCIETWNQSAQRVEGYTAQEALGRKFGLDLPTEDNTPQRMVDYLHRANQDGWYEDEGWRVRKDGSRFWANSIISVLQCQEGQDIDGYSVITRDITERKRSEDELRKLAATDFLTGAFNRGYFCGYAEKWIARCQQSGVPCCLLALDADFFKRINDRYGHGIGDEVLKTIVRTCENNVRSDDVVARLGGEEFVIMLPNTTPAVAMQIAERIRAAIEQSEVPAAGELVRFTVSVGVADLGDRLDDALQRADAALYLAKQDGRNCVRCKLTQEPDGEKMPPTAPKPGP